jgi:hypothetical protein
MKTRMVGTVPGNLPKRPFRDFSPPEEPARPAACQRLNKRELLHVLKSRGQSALGHLRLSF